MSLILSIVSIVIISKVIISIVVVSSDVMYYQVFTMVINIVLLLSLSIYSTLVLHLRARLSESTYKGSTLGLHSGGLRPCFYMKGSCEKV